MLRRCGGAVCTGEQDHECAERSEHDQTERARSEQDKLACRLVNERRHAGAPPALQTGASDCSRSRLVCLTVGKNLASDYTRASPRSTRRDAETQSSEAR